MGRGHPGGLGTATVPFSSTCSLCDRSSNLQFARFLNVLLFTFSLFFSLMLNIHMQTVPDLTVCLMSFRLYNDAKATCIHQNPHFEF